MSRRHVRLVAAAAVAVVPAALLLAGCADGTPRGVATHGPDPVLVTSGIRYAQAPDGWRDPTLDLYVPADAGEPALAVVVPEPGADPAVYEALARDIAERGVAAAVVRWGVLGQPPVRIAGRSAAEVVAQTELVDAEVGCALVAAAAQAGPGVGSPERPLLVVGHGSGANAAGMAALTPVARFDGCFAPDGSPHVAAALLWDGDWLGDLVGDSLGPDTARFLAAYSPWPSADSIRTSTYVEAGVNANRLDGRAVEAGPADEYLTSRDPTGELTADLREVDAFADGAVDPVDVTRAFAVGMGDGDVVTREREVHGEGDPDTLGPRVRALVVGSVVQLAATR